MEVNIYIFFSVYVYSVPWTIFSIFSIKGPFIECAALMQGREKTALVKDALYVF